jgi:uncharacterized protein (TIGR00251 family)
MSDEPDLEFDLREDGTTVVFGLKVQPGAKRTELVGTWQTSLKVKIGRKPEDGAANRECLEFFAEMLDVPRHRISIIKGEFSSSKVVRVVGMTAQVARLKIAQVWSLRKGH